MYYSYVMYHFLVLAILTKYYRRLWQSFPKDHMVSLERCCTVYNLKDVAVDYITSAQTSDLANLRLLDYITVTISHEIKESLFVFCNNLEVIIGTSNKSVIEEFQKGKMMHNCIVFSMPPICFI